MNMNSRNKSTPKSHKGDFGEYKAPTPPLGGRGAEIKDAFPNRFPNTC